MNYPVHSARPVVVFTVQVLLCAVLANFLVEVHVAPPLELADLLPHFFSFVNKLVVLLV